MDIIRYNPPSRYDKAPYGFIVKVIEDDNHDSMWIQTSEDQEIMLWMPIGNFLDELFKESIMIDADLKKMFLDRYSEIKKKRNERRDLNKT